MSYKLHIQKFMATVGLPPLPQTELQGTYRNIFQKDLNSRLISCEDSHGSIRLISLVGMLFLFLTAHVFFSVVFGSSQLPVVYEKDGKCVYVKFPNQALGTCVVKPVKYRKVSIK